MSSANIYTFENNSVYVPPHCICCKCMHSACILQTNACAQVQSFTHEQKAALNNGVCTAAPLPSPANSSPSSRSSDPHTTSLLCDKEFQLVWNPLYLQLLSALHFLLSLVLIFSYWNLKARTVYTLACITCQFVPQYFHSVQWNPRHKQTAFRNLIYSSIIQTSLSRDKVS